MFKRFWWMIFVMMPVAAVIAGVVVTVVSLFMTKQFESEAVVEIVPPAEVVSLEKPESRKQFNERQLSILQSRELLGRASDYLDLPGKRETDREGAITILEKSVRSKLVADTDLISIKVRHPSRGDTRDVATAIITAKFKHSFEALDRPEIKALNEVNRKIGEQNALTSESRNAEHEEQRGRPKLSRTGDRLIDLDDYFESNLRKLQEMEKTRDELLNVVARHLPELRIQKEPELPSGVVWPSVRLNALISSVFALVLAPLLAWPAAIWMNNRSGGQNGMMVSGSQGAPVSKRASEEEEW